MTNHAQLSICFCTFVKNVSGWLLCVLEISDPNTSEFLLSLGAPLNDTIFCQPDYLSYFTLPETKTGMTWVQVSDLTLLSSFFCSESFKVKLSQARASNTSKSDLHTWREKGAHLDRWSTQWRDDQYNTWTDDQHNDKMINTTPIEMINTMTDDQHKDMMMWD